MIVLFEGTHLIVLRQGLTHRMELQRQMNYGPMFLPLSPPELHPDLLFSEMVAFYLLQLV